MAILKERIVIIDGNALIHRGFHGLPQSLRTTDGTLVNGVYGFAVTILNVMKELHPEYFIVTFDAGGKVFRHNKFPEYKAKRLKAPQELYDQIPIVHELVEAMSIPIYVKKGFEADDLIGSLAKKVEEMNKENGRRIETYIVTGDKDTFQLLDHNTKIFKLRKSFTDTEIYDAESYKKDYGFEPKYAVDYRGLIGDTSDNIPGAPGIGEVVGKEIIENFKTLENLYKELDKVPYEGELKKGNLVIKGSKLKKLKDGKKLAFLSRELSQIKCDIPVKIDLKKSTLAKYDRDKVVAMFQKLQFRSLLKRLPEVMSGAVKHSEKAEKILEKEEASKQTNIFDVKKKLPIEGVDFVEKNKKAHYVCINTEPLLKKLVADLKKQKEFALDTETSALDSLDSELVGISVSFKEKTGYYIPVGHTEGEQLPKATVLKALRPVLENEKIGKIGQNTKYDYLVLMSHGVEVKGITFDTLLAAYVLNPGERGLGLDTLAFAELGYEMMPITDLIGTGKNQASFATTPILAATFYSSEDSDIAFRLKKTLERRLEKDKDIKKIFYEVEMPMIPILAHMERKGVLVDAAYLKKISKEMTARIQKISQGIFKEAGKHFNISSTQQLAQILFAKMGVSTEGIAKTKTGFSTAASELEKLRGKAKIVDAILDYRELTKLKNTYVDALPLMISKKDHRIHTTYNQTIAATGRLSSIDPNLQNIPVRTEEGRKIRHAFFAEKGKSFLALDYSQIELRIMAHISQDETFVDAFKHNKDIHATVAAQIHGKKPDQVTDEERREAKIINFAIMYGAGAKGLSSQTTMNYAEAKDYVEKYFEIHPKVRATIDKYKKFAHEHEYVQSLYGRKRFLPDINASFPLLRSGAERAAINMPFQGTNADIMKLAMMKLIDEMPELSEMMILQVHDELIFEISDAQIKKYAPKIQKIMENIFPLDVPLKVGVEVGKRWSDLEELNL
jgi:DNA polymerase-1